MAAQRAQQLLPALDADGEVTGSGRQIRMVQVVGRDAQLNKGAHEAGQRGLVVIDVFQQHSLRAQGDAGVGQPCHSLPGRSGELLWVVGVNHDPGRLRGAAQQRDQRVGHPLRVGHGNASVYPEDANVLQRPQTLDDGSQPSRR